MISISSLYTIHYSCDQFKIALGSTSSVTTVAANKSSDEVTISRSSLSCLSVGCLDRFVHGTGAAGMGHI